MEVNVVDLQGSKVKTLSVNGEIWNFAWNDYLVSKYVYVYLNNQRKFSANTKTRGKVRGGGRKPHRQKGTGRARQGSKRSPIFVGGGVVGGPVSGKRWLKLNKKERKAIGKIIISRLLKDGRLIIISADSLNVLEKGLDDKKQGFTSLVAKNVQKFAIESKRGILLLRVDGLSKMKLGLKNNGSLCYNTVSNLNWYDLLRSSIVLVDESVIGEIEDKLS